MKQVLHEVKLNGFTLKTLSDAAVLATFELQEAGSSGAEVERLQELMSALDFLSRKSASGVSVVITRRFQKPG